MAKNMNETLDAVLFGFDRCIQLAQALEQCFDEERTHLIALRMEELAECTLRKAALSRELVQERGKLRELLHFAGPVESEAITQKQSEWARAWDRMHFSCESNQRLLKNSVRNLDMLSDHLKRLMGDKSRYSKQGKRVEASAPGMVIGSKSA